MNITKIKINNFKSIYEELELDFQDMTGFWKISGSVGAGKTTIGEAIIYGLFGSINGKNNNDLISWGRKRGEIQLWCTSKGHDIYIKRELKSYGQSQLYVEVDDEELLSSNKRDTQQQLESEYYDTSRVTLELLCIISFNNFKSLATLNSSDAKKFLDQVLGFHILTDYIDSCKELKNSNSHNINRIVNQINILESQINKLKEISLMEYVEGDVDDVKRNIISKQKEYEDIKKREQLEKKDNQLKIKELEKKQATVLVLGKNKKKEIDFIEKGICPTCGASIDQSQLDIKKQERDILLGQYNDILKDIENVIEESKQIELKYAKIYTPILNDINTLKKLHTKLEEQSKRMNVHENEINNINNDIQKYQEQLECYKKDDIEWEELYNILSNDIKSTILQLFIPSLNKNIQYYTQKLHLPYTITFDHNFKCNINILGPDQSIPVSSLSTGQLKVVDMVIIMGVLGTVIGMNGINILFLDELFSNLDINLRNEMCQLLRENLKEDSTIFIISHMELEDKYFDGEVHMKIELKNQYEKHSICRIEKIKNDIKDL